MPARKTATGVEGSGSSEVAERAEPCRGFKECFVNGGDRAGGEVYDRPGHDERCPGGRKTGDHSRGRRSLTPDEPPARGDSNRPGDGAHGEEHEAVAEAVVNAGRSGEDCDDCKGKETISDRESAVGVPTRGAEAGAASLASRWLTRVPGAPRRPSWAWRLPRHGPWPVGDSFRGRFGLAITHECGDQCVLGEFELRHEGAVGGAAIGNLELRTSASP